MGEILLRTDRVNVARDKKKAELPGVTPLPTLSDLGISKRERRHPLSSQAEGQRGHVKDRTQAGQGSIGNEAEGKG